MTQQGGGRGCGPVRGERGGQVSEGREERQCRYRWYSRLPVAVTVGHGGGGDVFGLLHPVLRVRQHERRRAGYSLGLSQVKYIPNEVHDAGIVTSFGTSLSINESCDFSLRVSFLDPFPVVPHNVVVGLQSSKYRLITSQVNPK